MDLRRPRVHRRSNVGLVIFDFTFQSRISGMGDLFDLKRKGYGSIASGDIIFTQCTSRIIHDDVIKWKHFPRNWPFVRGIHRSPVNSPYKDQWHGALMFSFICVWINDWANNREAEDLRPYRAHYNVIVMFTAFARIVASLDIIIVHNFSFLSFS